jgi:hypothetical protein
MSDQARAMLENLRVKTDADSLAEVIRKALAVYDLVWTAIEKGKTLSLKGVGNGDDERVLRTKQNWRKPAKIKARAPILFFPQSSEARCRGDDSVNIRPLKGTAFRLTREGRQFCG